MANVLVNIVSEQTIPNFLFIKEFQKDIDIFLFISTEEMERKKKTEYTFKTASIEKVKVRKILIHEDQLFLVQSKLKKLGWETQPHKYFVNLTGGTKLMAISIFEYFKNFESRFFYLPYGKNTVKELFTNKEAIVKAIDYKISLKEYFSLLNIKFDARSLFLKKEQCFQVFENFSLSNFHLDSFPKDSVNSHLSKNKLKRYNSANYKPGDWFEEFVYYLFKEKYNMNPNGIKTGLKLFSGDNYKLNLSDFDNEIDLAYIKDNELHTLEAKVSIGKTKPNITTITNILYKISAVNSGFGLKPRSGLITLSNFSKLHKESLTNVKRRCEVIGIDQPIDTNAVKHLYSKLK